MHPQGTIVGFRFRIQLYRALDFGSERILYENIVDLDNWGKDALTEPRVILTYLLLPQGAGAEEQEGEEVSYSLAPHFFRS